MLRTSSLLATVVLGAVSLLSFGGCSGKDEDARVLRVVRNVGGREGFRRHWEAWKNAFERDNPGWKMDLINVGNVQGTEFYMSRIATRDLPEVIQTWTLTKFLADHGHVLAIPDEYFRKFGMPLPDAYKGKRYATMGSLQLQGIAVNMKMWRAIGITEPPQTWEAFVAALAKLKAAGYKPITYAAKEWTAAVPMGYGFGTNLYEYRSDNADVGGRSWTRRKDAGKVSFAEDPVAQKVVGNLIELLGNFAGEGAMSDGYNEAKGQFLRGKSATWLMGCWVGGDLEPNKVDLEIEYWPIPSMVGRKPVFLTGSYMQTGWAVTTTPTGAKREKAYAVLDALYDPKVYQTWLNAESMIPSARKVSGVVGPKSDWPAAKRFYQSMIANHEKYGHTRGAHIAMDDMVPVGIETPMKQVMQEILQGKRDVPRLLKKLDDAWAKLRKAEGGK